MAANISRRNMLKGLTAAAAVVAWDPQTGWLTESQVATAPSGPHLAHVPPLDGTLSTTSDDLDSFGGDFGRLVSGAPMAVLRPGSVNDIAVMVDFARRRRLTVAMNGQSGPPDMRESHSTYGQAQAPGGIVIDARTMSTIHHVDATSADVDAGVSWGDLVMAAAAHGAKPPVLPDYLQLSVGGLLSVGGIGGEVQRFGTAADNVDELEVVTAWGRIVRCSRTRRPDLFFGALAGAGQIALIVRAKLRLVPSPPAARVYRLVYTDPAGFVADQLKVMDEGKFSYQEGLIVRAPDDSGWLFVIEVATYYTPPEAPDDDTLLAGLSDVRPFAEILDLPFLQWASRLEPVVEQLAAGGFLDQPKPWVSVFVPASRAAEFISSVASQLQPTDLGAGLAGLYPVRRSAIDLPYFALPDEAVSFQLNLLRFPFPGFPGIDGMLAQNRIFFDEAVVLGGKRSLVGSIPDMTPSDWRRHYGRAWPAFKLQKLVADPLRVLTPGQGIF